MSFLEKNLPSPNDLLHLMFTSPTIVDFFDCADISSAVGSVGPSACAGTWVLTLSRQASSPHQLRNACRQWARSPVFEPFCRLRAAAPCAESSVVSKRLHCTGDRMCHKTRVLQGWSRNNGPTTTTTTTTTPPHTRHHHRSHEQPPPQQPQHNNHHNNNHHHNNNNHHNNHHNHCRICLGPWPAVGRKPLNPARGPLAVSLP